MNISFLFLFILRLLKTCLLNNNWERKKKLNETTLWEKNLLFIIVIYLSCNKLWAPGSQIWSNYLWTLHNIAYSAQYKYIFPWIESRRVCILLTVSCDYKWILYEQNITLCIVESMSDSHIIRKIQNCFLVFNLPLFLSGLQYILL